MKEVNPLGIRLGFTKYWNLSYISSIFNYRIFFKKIFLVTTKIFSFVENSSYFIIFLLKKLTLYYQFLKKKYKLYAKYVFKFLSYFPNALTNLSYFFTKNLNISLFLLKGFFLTKKHFYKINLILFYFNLIKKYILNTNIFFFSGVIYLEINYTSIINKFKYFRYKFFFYKNLFLNKVVLKNKNTKFIKVRKKYSILVSNSSNISLQAYTNFKNQITKNVPIFKITSLHLKRSYKKFSTNKNIRKKKIYIYLLKSNFLRKKIQIARFLKSKWYILKRYIKFKFFQLSKSITSSVYSFKNKILSKYLFFFFNCFFVKRNNMSIFKSSKLFTLYIHYIKTHFENFFYKQYNLNIKLYFKNYFKFIKINSGIKNIYFMMRKHFFYKNLIKRYFFQLEMLNIFIIAIATRNVRLLVMYLGTLLERNRKHSKVLRNFKLLVLEFLVKIPIFLGLKLKISGKFHGKTRASSRTLYIYRNIFSIMTFKSKINYSYFAADTFTGIFGIHLWLFYK